MTKRIRRLGALALLGFLGACGGGGGGGGDFQGIVSQLTGDPDREVSPALQSLVQRAFFIPADGQPIDD